MDVGAGLENGFARRYLPAVEAYLRRRWGSGRWAVEHDDAVQEVFVECFREGGVLGRVEKERPGGFRAFLYGAVRNVARRFESRSEKAGHDGDLDAIERDETTLSRVFDRAWALALLRQTWSDLEVAAGQRSESEAPRRLEYLRLRFQDQLPPREIAGRWDVTPESLHELGRRARRDFRAALLRRVAFHHPTTPGEAERECNKLLGLFD